MKKLVHIFMLSCKKATELIEKKLHTNLSGRERLQLRLHKTICDACTLYEKQVVFLDKALKKEPTDSVDETSFPPEEIKNLQDKIIQTLKK